MVKLEELKKGIGNILKEDELTDEEVNEYKRRDRFFPSESYHFRLIRASIGLVALTLIMNVVYPSFLTKPLIPLPIDGFFTYNYLIAPVILFFVFLYGSEWLGGYVLNKLAWGYDVIIGRIKPSEAVRTIILVLILVVMIVYFKIFPLQSIR